MSELLRRSSLICLFLITALSVQAQREIDLSLADIITPDTIFEGEAPYVKFAVQNLGPSYIIPNDTIMFRVGFEDNHQTTGFFIFHPKRSIYAMDTFQIAIQHPVAFNWPGASYRSNICALAIIFNRGGENPVIPESGETVRNNELCKEVNYINEDGWGVEVQESEQKDVVISPNPVRGTLHLEGIPVNHGLLYLELTDPMGRTVQRVAIDEETSLDVSTEDMKPGLYYCRIAGTDFELIRKLLVLN